MYTDKDFKSKKSLKEAIKNGEKVRVYQPGGIFHPPQEHEYFSGKVSVEGPHYPQPHRWYAEVELVGGVIVEVK